MIGSFKDKEAEKIFNREYSRKLPREIQDVAFRKLRMLNRAVTLQDLKVPPGNRLEPLKGQRAANIAFESTISNESALSGRNTKHTRSRS